MAIALVKKKPKKNFTAILLLRNILYPYNAILSIILTAILNHIYYMKSIKNLC